MTRTTPKIGALILTIITTGVFLCQAFPQSANAVNVYPSPGTPVASDTTTFSFRGLQPAELGKITILGSRSGRHFGKRLKHSDGLGVSIVPNREFVRGEKVTIRTSEKIQGARHGDFTVRIARFYSDDLKMSRPRKKNSFPALKSRPGLRPPRLQVLKTKPEAGEQKVFFAPKETGLTIADRLGRVSWFRPTEYGGRGQEVQDFRVQTYRGKPALTYWRGAASQHGNFQVGRFHILNEKFNEIARFGAGNGYQPDAHEFVISPRSTALAIAYRGVTWDLRKFGGKRHGKVFDNVVQEIDIPTGAVLFEWHSIGNVKLGDSVSRPEKDGFPWDYFHLNSIEDDGDGYLLSARKTSSIYRISKTGQVDWRMRGDGRKPSRNDFAMGKGTRFGYQHDARRLPNGDISLFDNAVAKQFAPIRHQSSALILRIAENKVKLVKRYDHPKRVAAKSQGSSEVLPNGNVFVGWGSEPRLTQFGAAGDVIFDATFEAPVNSYRAYLSGWQGTPPGRPAIASLGSGRGGTVWASWNGSSDVSRWRVLTGPGQGDLHLAKEAPWTGLETAMPVKRLGAWVQVEALGAQGQILATSRVTRAGTRSHGKPLRPTGPGRQPPPLSSFSKRAHQTPKRPLSSRYGERP